MWVCKQDNAAEWQQFATPATPLRHVKAEGAPSTLQQVQIERAAKNSKPRNDFEFSLKPPTAASPQQPPQFPSRLRFHYDAIHWQLRRSLRFVVLQQQPRQIMWGDELVLPMQTGCP